MLLRRGDDAAHVCLQACQAVPQHKQRQASVVKPVVCILGSCPSSGSIVATPASAAAACPVTKEEAAGGAVSHGIGEGALNGLNNHAALLASAAHAHPQRSLKVVGQRRSRGDQRCGDAGQASHVHAERRG